MDTIVFVASALLLFYTYAGYALLVAAWARWRPRPVQWAPICPRVAVIIVAYNEEPRIVAKLRTCLDQDYPAGLVRIMVATDGSVDGTAALVAAIADSRVQLLPFSTRRGKAACINDAAAACDEEVLIFTDARQALDPRAVRCLVETLGDPEVGAVSGELVFLRDDMTPFGEAVDAYWKYEKFIRRCEAAVHSVPGVTGALYAIRRSCFAPIQHRTILDDVAIPMQAVRAGYRTVFDSRAIAYDRPSKSSSQERVRKVRTLAGNYQLLALMPWLLVPGINPIVVQFVSHKVLRLVAPFAMLALLGANLSLAFRSGACAVVLVLHLLLYGLALSALYITGLAKWRPARLASAFLVMNWYAVLGLAQYLRDPSGHLWQSPAEMKRG